MNTTPDNINVDDQLDLITANLQSYLPPDHFEYVKGLLHKLLVAEKQVTGDTSDGYHTFNELYHYRMLYNALYANELVKNQPLAVNKSKRHSDGELCFGGGWFVVMMFLPTGQVTNHYELKDWDKFHCDELDTAPEWDGHTPQEAVKRMEAQLTQLTQVGDK
jgi:hypothetical protein